MVITYGSAEIASGNFCWFRVDEIFSVFIESLQLAKELCLIYARICVILFLLHVGDHLYVRMSSTMWRL